LADANANGHGAYPTNNETESTRTQSYKEEGGEEGKLRRRERLQEQGRQEAQEELRREKQESEEKEAAEKAKREEEEKAKLADDAKRVRAGLTTTSYFALSTARPLASSFFTALSNSSNVRTIIIHGSNHAPPEARTTAESSSIRSEEKTSMLPLSLASPMRSIHRTAWSIARRARR
jgi:multidrug efflux pump subunit AcrA (membrane-fusion protein)